MRDRSTISAWGLEDILIIICFELFLPSEVQLAAESKERGKGGSVRVAGSVSLGKATPLTVSNFLKMCRDHPNVSDFEPFQRMSVGHLLTPKCLLCRFRNILNRVRGKDATRGSCAHVQGHTHTQDVF